MPPIAEAVARGGGGDQGLGAQLIDMELAAEELYRPDPPGNPGPGDQLVSRQDPARVVRNARGRCPT